jgi:hypothetical protein
MSAPCCLQHLSQSLAKGANMALFAQGIVVKLSINTGVVMQMLLRWVESSTTAKLNIKL